MYYRVETRYMSGVDTVRIDPAQTRVVARAGVVHLRDQGDQVERYRASTLMVFMSWSSILGPISACTAKIMNCDQNWSRPLNILWCGRASLKAPSCTLSASVCVVFVCRLRAAVRRVYEQPFVVRHRCDDDTKGVFCRARFSVHPGCFSGCLPQPTVL